MSSSTFASIVVFTSIPQATPFLYRVPDSLSPCLTEGQLVRVPFGTKELLGIVWEIQKNQMLADESYTIKDVLEVITTTALILPQDQQLLSWMQRHYLASILSCVKAFLPQFLLKDPTPLEMKKSGKTAPENYPVITLTAEQDEAVKTILANPTGKFLLHGITGSGKTEVYIRVIEHMLAHKKQSLLLLPEIALTPQMRTRFVGHFGSQVAVWHSGLTPKQRKITWHGIRKGTISVVIGSRSAVFAPFTNLGAIIVDEEHEQTYKQDTAPRYHARAVAEERARIAGAVCVLGSATPAVESYYKATIGEYQLLTLSSRFFAQLDRNKPSPITEHELPSVQLIDMKREWHAGKKDFLSTALLNEIQATLDRKDITLLFLNRRGYSPYIFCRDCGESIPCPSCEVPLSLHTSLPMLNTPARILLCHHCGRTIQPPTVCSQCKGHQLSYGGIGTQKVEERIQELFPEARIARLDRDTSSKAKFLEHLYDDLCKGKIDIVIGTQLLAKGWDIPKLTTVGIVLADVGLQLPDFRAGERTFQLLTQVAGRAGRYGSGKVICQTYLPEHYAVSLASKHDYQSFYEQEIGQRKALSYPPFIKLAKLSFAHASVSKGLKSIEKMEFLLEKIVKEQNIPVQGAMLAIPSFIPKLRGQFRWDIIIKAPDFHWLTNLPLIGWKVDIEPVSML